MEISPTRPGHLMVCMKGMPVVGYAGLVCSTHQFTLEMRLGVELSRQ